MKKHTIGIIGGEGKMGSLFVEIFEKLGHTVLISDKNTSLSNIELAKRAEVILLSVTFGHNIAVIREIGPYLREDQLLLDVASLKEKILREMLKTKASVIGMHPLFGPRKDLEGQGVILCPQRPGKWKDWIIGVIEQQGIEVSILDPHDHDHLMAYVQALSHFTLLIFSDVISHEINVSNSLKHSTPVYQLLVSLGSRVLSQSPDLYAGIEMYNEHFPKALLALRSAFDHLERIVKDKNKKAYKSFFEHIGKRLGEVKEKGLELSNELLRHIK